jgi:hypothetical protein
MQIDAAIRREVEHPLRNDAAVGDDEDGLRKNVFEQGAELEVVLDLLRLNDRNAVFESYTLYGRRLHFHAPACGAVGLRDHKGNFVTGSDDGFEGRNGELRSATED